MLILDLGVVQRSTKRRFLKFFSVFLLLFLFTNAAYAVLPLRAKAVTPGYNGKIAYAHRQNTSSNWQIYAMNPDGTGQTNISNNTANDYEPSWSPDGTKIAFASDR